MDISLANERAFQLTPQVPLETARVRVDDKRTGLVAGTVGALLTRPKAEDIQLVATENRLEPFWLITIATRTRYDRNRTFSFTVAGPEVQQVTVLDHQVTVDRQAKGGPTVQLTGVEHCQEEARLTADLLPGMAAANVQAQIDKWLKDEKLVPEGVNIVPLGQAQAQAREMPYMMFAFGLAILLVYMVLASLFDNLLYPFVIQLAQPQAMVGALLALMITDKALNIVGFIGIMTLVGLVGKNAILLVDFTNTLRARGRTRHDALVEAGPIRLRPIMMTTLAIVFGMLPVALAIGRGSEFRETIGITIIGGIIVSTMLTLLVIPCSYSIFDDFSNWLGRIFGGRAKGSKKVQPPSPPRQDDPLDEPEPVLQPGS